MEKTELDEHRPELRESTENEDADQDKFLTGIKLFLVMAAISLNTFMVSMVSLRSKQVLQEFSSLIVVHDLCLALMIRIKP